MDYSRIKKFSVAQHRVVGGSIKGLVWAILFVLAAGRLIAQTGGTGSILGSVVDSTGAVIPKAAVTVTNTGTGVKSKATTTSAGDYTVLSLIPGQYSVLAESPGFAKEDVTGITLAVAQQARVNLVLKPGDVSATVTVAADATQLDTDNAAISQLVSSRQVTELPLNGRNFFDLLFIGAGAVETGGEQSGHPGAGEAISINGSRPESNSYLLDGILNTDQTTNVPSNILSIDAIQEFKVLSETYSAQYGLGANQISVVSRSGTNDFHGALFEFLRNDAFDARNYFQSSSNAKLRQNQFGFVLDGPVRIPWLYNGRDKTFFMANYEGQRLSAGAGTGYTTVPTPAELAGCFSTSVTDPTTGMPFAGGGGCVSQIPAARFSRLAKVTIAQGFIPGANCSGCGGNALNNYSYNSTNTLKSNQQTYRIDQDLHKWGRLFGRGTYSTYNPFGAGGASAAASGSGTSGINTNWAAGYTTNFGAHIVNQFIMGVMDSYLVNFGAPVAASVQTSLGFSGVFTNLTPQQRSYPTIGFGNQNAEHIGTFGGANNAYTSSDNPMWQYSDALSYIRGAHTFTVGGDYKRWTLYRNNASNFLGQYTFNDGVATGNQLGDFLLGYYGAANGFLPGPFGLPNSAGNLHDYQFRYYATYLQDDWKVNSKLTLNLGVRWDIRPIPYDAHNRLTWRDTSNTLGGLCFADPKLATDGVAPPGNGYYRYCGSNHPGKTEYNNFAPRLGFAYRLDPKTVVRGGFGLVWDGVEGREMDDSGDVYPYVSRQNLSQVSGQASFKTTDQLWPDFSSIVPVTPAANTFIAVVNSENPKNPYMTQWSFSVERELARNTTLEMNYIGNKGSRLLARQNINQALLIPNLTACYTTTPEPDSCLPVNRRPYPNFVTYIDSSWIAHSNYNALNVKLEHRSSQFALTSIYTWAKSLDDKSTAASAGSEAQGWNGYLNNHDPELDYGRSDFNVGQRFVTSLVYDLPVGRGKKFANQVNPVVNAVIGGWEGTTIATFQQGFPTSIQCNDYYAPTNVGGLLDIGTGGGINRCDQVGDPKNLKWTHKSSDFAANAALFAAPTPGVFGNSARNVATAPGLENFVLGLYKNTDITERVKFQLRFEAFNAFNHPQFDADPNGGFGGGGSSVNNVLSSGQLGLIGAAGPPRILQIGGKLVF
jgi:hypothetical protein